jgi:hypothetical protein
LWRARGFISAAQGGIAWNIGRLPGYSRSSIALYYAKSARMRHINHPAPDVAFTAGCLVAAGTGAARTAGGGAYGSARAAALINVDSEPELMSFSTKPLKSCKIRPISGQEADRPAAPPPRR